MACGVRLWEETWEDLTRENSARYGPGGHSARWSSAAHFPETGFVRGELIPRMELEVPPHIVVRRRRDAVAVVKDLVGCFRRDAALPGLQHVHQLIHGGSRRLDVSPVVERPRHLHLSDEGIEIGTRIGVLVR